MAVGSRAGAAAVHVNDLQPHKKYENVSSKFNWLWHRQLLRHEKLRWVWRRIRVGRLCYYYCCCTPRDRILSTQTFFGTPLHLILSTQTFSSNSLAPDSYYTNFFLQPLCTWFYLHKLFLATPLHLTLTTQTFSSNSSARDSYYTHFF